MLEKYGNIRCPECDSGEINLKSKSQSRVEMEIVEGDHAKVASVMKDVCTYDCVDCNARFEEDE